MPPASREPSARFERIAQALRYIEAHVREQPSLQTVASRIGLSPAHFQRVFTDWVGTSPKRFLQYVSLERAKSLLKEERLSLQRAAWKTGLSGSSRLHDLFVTVEGMTPGEYKNGGASLTISYAFSETPFGRAIVASTDKGVCYLAFHASDQEAINDVRSRFPRATLKSGSDDFQTAALSIFRADWTDLPRIKLHLRGTDFQLHVWRALLTVPAGTLTTYGSLAGRIQRPKAYRAVGTAVGENPVSFLIPCHRVIQSTGVLGNYRWDPARKTAMIGWEGVKTAPPVQGMNQARTPSDVPASGTPRRSRTNVV